MANFGAIAAVGASLVRLLDHAFLQGPPVAGNTARAGLARTDDLETGARAQLIGSHGVTLLLYRVEPNATMRAAWGAAGGAAGRSRLALDLHYLLTPWSTSAPFEQAILGRAMQALDETPLLAGALLDGAGGFAANEALQVAHEELSNEALMRVFDSLTVDYRLSVAYVVRVVRIDGRETRPDRAVHAAVAGVGS
jgi:hypothetical protein